MIQICTSYTLEALRGIHDLSADVIKAALYASAAALSQNTTVYSSSNEISNGGYTSGGGTLVKASGYPQLVSETAEYRIDDFVWTFAPAQALRYGLIYNSSKANRAIAVIDFGVITVASLRLKNQAGGPAALSLRRPQVF